MQTVLLDPCSYNFLILDKINNSDVLHEQNLYTKYWGNISM